MPDSSSWWLTNWPYAGFTTVAIIRTWRRVCRSIVNGWKLSGSAYWDFYKQLRVYQQGPTPERAAQLQAQFDELFSTVTGYEEPDRRIARTMADKTYLLMVLEHPEIPLHNNPAELDARTRVRKRAVSYGPRSQAGARTWDAMETLLSTARKLGVNFFQYIRDRVSGAMKMPSLAELIKQRAETMNLRYSWKPS